MKKLIMLLAIVVALGLLVWALIFPFITIFASIYLQLFGAYLGVQIVYGSRTEDFWEAFKIRTKHPNICHKTILVKGDLHPLERKKKPKTSYVGVKMIVKQDCGIQSVFDPAEGHYSVRRVLHCLLEKEKADPNAPLYEIIHTQVPDFS